MTLLHRRAIFEDLNKIIELYSEDELGKNREIRFHQLDQRYIDAFYIFGISCLLFIAFQLYRESHVISKTKYYIIIILTYTSTCLYYFKLSFVNSHFFDLMIIFTTVVAPFINKDNDELVVPFMYKILEAISLWTLLRVIFYTMLLVYYKVTMPEIDLIKLNEIYFANKCIPFALLISSLIFLSKIPYVNELSSRDYPKKIIWVLKFIFVPVIVVYGLLLNISMIPELELNIFFLKFSTSHMPLITLILFTIFILTFPAVNSSTAFAFIHKHLPKILVLPMIGISIVICNMFLKYDINIALNKGAHQLTIFMIGAWVTMAISTFFYKKSPKYTLILLIIMMRFIPIIFKIII